MDRRSAVCNQPRCQFDFHADSVLDEKLTIGVIRYLIVLATIIWMIFIVWPYYRWVAVAQMPYLIWVTIATSYNCRSRR